LRLIFVLKKKLLKMTTEAFLWLRMCPKSILAGGPLEILLTVLTQKQTLSRFSKEPLHGRKGGKWE